MLFVTPHCLLNVLFFLYIKAEKPGDLRALLEKHVLDDGMGGARND